MKRAIRLATALAGAPAFAPAAALATPPSDNAEAFKHFDRAVRLTDEEDWSTALVEFERAYDLAPDYRVLFNIAQCRYQLHDYPGALSAFQRYLAEGKDSIAADRRSKVEADIEVLEGRVGLLRVSSEVAGAEVLVDDTPVGTTPLSAPIVISAGRHKITLRRQGAALLTRQVALTGEEEAEIALDPVIATAAVPPPSFALGGVPAVSEQGRVPPSAHVPSTVPAWVSFGVAAAGGGVGVYFGLAAIDGKNRLERECLGKVCPPSAQPLIASSQRDGLVSTIGTAVGAAGAVGGIVYLSIVMARRKRTERGSAALILGPGWIAGSGSF